MRLQFGLKSILMYVLLSAAFLGANMTPVKTKVYYIDLKKTDAYCWSVIGFPWAFTDTVWMHSGSSPIDGLIIEISDQVQFANYIDSRPGAHGEPFFDSSALLKNALVFLGGTILFFALHLRRKRPNVPLSPPPNVT